MSHFIDKYVSPKIQVEPRLQWIAQYKKGPTVNYAIDFKIYTKNRPFRVIYAKKHGKTSLVPWDPVWRDLTFTSKEQWFESSLVTGGGAEHATMIPRRQARQPPISFPEAKTDAEKHAEPPPRRSSPSPADSLDAQQLDRALARQLVSFLSEERSTWAGIVGRKFYGRSILFLMGRRETDASSELLCRVT